MLRPGVPSDRNEPGFGAFKMANTKTPSDLTRPLSPHLQIYRPMLTMMMSIVHRLSARQTPKDNAYEHPIP